MAIATAIAAIGAAVGIAGTVNSYMEGQSASKANSQASAAAALAQQRQTQANRKILDIQQNQDNLRREQMNLEAQIQQRQLIRAAQVARAQAVNASVQQGSGNSTGIGGVLASIGQQQGEQLRNIRTNQVFGNKMFDFNKEINTTNRRYADVIGSLNQQAAMFQSQANQHSANAQGYGAFASFGMNMMQNAQTASNVIRSTTSWITS